MTLPAIVGTTDFAAVWGPAGGPVYAVGSSGTIVRFDGTEWTLADRVAQDLVGIWGTGASDIWAIGARGLIAHFDGTAWDDNASLGGNIASNIEGIWGSGPDRDLRRRRHQRLALRRRGVDRVDPPLAVSGAGGVGPRRE